MKRILLSLALASSSLLSIQAQSTIYVNDDATGNNDGSSWANAYNDLNEALTNSSTNDEIWIAEGFYTRTSSTETFRVDNDVRIYGGFSGNETDKDQRNIKANPTVVSGDVSWNDQGIVSSSNSYMQDNAEHVFEVHSTNRAVFDGLIIEHAFSTTAAGGGIYVYSQSMNNLEISNCIIRENVSANRAGVLFYSEVPAAFLMYNNIIEKNVNADFNSAYTVEYRITGNSHVYSEVHMVNNLFNDNITEAFGMGGTCGRFTITPGGCEIDIFLINNTFINNAQGSNIPGLFAYESHGASSYFYPHISNNIFYNNYEATDIFRVSNGSANTLVIFPEDSHNNIQDFPDLQGLTNTQIINATPFVDFVNGDYRPIAAYETGGNPAMYSNSNLIDVFADQMYPELDLAGNPRFNTQGEIAIGASQAGPNTLSVDDLKETANLSIFPNPADNIITIKHELTGNLDISIYTLTGAQVSNTVLSDNLNTIDVSNLPTGYYILKAKSGNQEHVEKLIIK
mgnify:CR=1 FL=1